MEFYIFVTKKCNLNCRYCVQNNVMKLSRTDEKYLDVYQTANFVIKNLSKDKNNVVFYGGEPLLNQEWIKDFIKLTKGNNLTYTLQTNATLLNKLDDFILENLNFIYISLDGNKQLTDNLRGMGVYDLILENIHKIKPKFKGKLLARITLMPENSIFDSIKSIIALNLFDYIHWQLENSPIKTNFQKSMENYERDIEKLINFWFENLDDMKTKIVPFNAIILSLLTKKQSKSYRCGAGTYLVTINSDGNCYSCDYLLEPPFKIGNIREGVKQKQLISKNNIRFCANCEINQICGGRCFEASIKFPTEKFRFYCDMTKILVKEMQEKIPEIEALIQNGTISIKDLEYDCFTEEIP